MIRAVVNNGIIQPLEPLPTSWTNGRELIVDAPEEASVCGSDDMDKWAIEMNALTANLNDPSEWQTIEAILAQADEAAKAQVRREMGLN
jgi:hypothetical protein